MSLLNCSCLLAPGPVLVGTLEAAPNGLALLEPNEGLVVLVIGAIAVLVDALSVVFVEPNGDALDVAANGLGLDVAPNAEVLFEVPDPNGVAEAVAPKGDC